MKKSKIVLFGALAIAGVYALSKSGVFGAAESPGGLGGSDDDSLTAEGNPFARIDPNYQYPAPTIIVIGPDGSVTTEETSPDDGSITTTTPEGIITTGGGEYTDPYAPKWYDNPLAYGAGLAGGYLAVEGAVRGTKKLFSKPKIKDLPGAKIKSAEVTKNPMDLIREKLGFKARLPQQEIMQAKYTTDADFAKGPKTEKLGGKVAKTAGKVLIVGHVIDRTFGAWNEYGSNYLEPRINAQGDVKGATLGSTAKAVGVTGAVGTTNILGDLFAFGTGLVYRPKSGADEYKDWTTGWFASEKDIWGTVVEGVKDPGSTLKSFTGYNQIAAAFGASQKSSKPSSGPETQPNIRAAFGITPAMEIAAKSSAPSTPTQTLVTAKKSSGSRGSSKNQVSYQNPKATVISSSTVNAMNKSLASSGVSPTSPHNAATKAKAATEAVKAGQSYKKYF